MANKIFKPSLIVRRPVAATFDPTINRGVDINLFKSPTGDVSVRSFVDKSIVPLFNQLELQGVANGAIQVHVTHGHLPTDDPTGKKQYSFQAPNIAAKSDCKWLDVGFTSAYNILPISRRQRLYFYTGTTKTLGEFGNPSVLDMVNKSYDQFYNVPNSGLFIDSTANATLDPKVWAQYVFDKYLANRRPVAVEGSNLEVWDLAVWWYLESRAAKDAVQLKRITSEIEKGRTVICQCSKFAMDTPIESIAEDIKWAITNKMIPAITCTDINALDKIGLSLKAIETLTLPR